MVSALAFFTFTTIDFSFYGLLSDCVNRAGCATMGVAQRRESTRNPTSRGEWKHAMATRTASAQDIQKQFEQAGFVVANDAAGRLEIKKSGCVAFLEKQGATLTYSGTPYLVVRGIACELEDRGYQKFWYAKTEGKRFPIRKEDLQVIHLFDEEVRYILGIKTLYNEGLGSTNARTVYDRLTGRADR
jgi:hypothetical protein